MSAKKNNMKKHATKCKVNTEALLGPYHECDCDGYHTFDELYDHRITLYIALCHTLYKLYETEGAPSPIWRSKKHSDGELCFVTGTQYVLGIFQDNESQITYHIPIERWDETNFAVTLELAPEWDKHTSDEVLKRLSAL